METRKQWLVEWWQCSMKVLREPIQIGSAIHASIHCLCKCGHSGVYDASPVNGRTFPPLTLPGRKVNGHFTCCKLAKLSNWLSLLLVMITGCIWYLLQLYCWICICCFIYCSSSNNLCHHWADHCIRWVCSVLEEWYWCNTDRCCWKWHHKFVSTACYMVISVITNCWQRHQVMFTVMLAQYSLWMCSNEFKLGQSAVKTPTVPSCVSL